MTAVLPPLPFPLAFSGQPFQRQSHSCAKLPHFMGYVMLLLVGQGCLNLALPPPPHVLESFIDCLC